MMLSAGGGASCFSFHLPMRGLAGCAATEQARTTMASGTNERCLRMVSPKERSILGRTFREIVMRRSIVVLLVLLALPAPAFATWSIVAVDRSTGRVVIASATCVDRDDEFLKGVQAVVVPGKGVAACQAAV